MDSKELKRDDIEELVSFLPILYADNVELYTIEPDEESISNFYNYNDSVNSFIQSSSKACWMVSEYNDELINNDNIKNASLEEIKGLLTFCIRGERFSSGHIAHMIEKKVIKRILNRLNVILEKHH